LVEHNLPSPQLISAYRAALISAGDGLLWSGLKGEAIEHYLQAEAAAGDPLPLSVRAARTGSYPYALEEHLVNREWTDAARILDRWEEDFPSDKAKGQTFYWRGRLHLAREEAARAARFLGQSLLLAKGAPYENQARWLLANAYTALGEHEKSDQTLNALLQSGIQDEFTEKARARLK
jgi:tetratricopeptide (TPR) repeat protein